ncbi:MAG TPA: NTF2 fold immunity protein [Rhizomicrobium sp.]|nr:NTF2 fold immunity protein [Rhizomicrobium sp.]
MKWTIAGLFASAMLLFVQPLFAQPGYIPKAGFVPDAATATAIARVVLIRVYGAAKIREEEPPTANRSGDIWTVAGTLPCPKVNSCVGGTAKLQLSAKDGRILRVIHTR